MITGDPVVSILALIRNELKLVKNPTSKRLLTSWLLISVGEELKLQQVQQGVRTGIEPGIIGFLSRHWQNIISLFHCDAIIFSTNFRVSDLS